MEYWIVPLFLVVILLCVIALYRLNSKTGESIKVIAQFIKNRESIDKVKKEIELLKNTNKDLEDEIKMGQIFYDNSKEAIIVMDSVGKIISTNPAFKVITGYTIEEIKGESLSILDAGKLPEKAYKEIYKRASEKGRCEQEIWNRKKTGEIYNEKLSLTTVLDVNGEISNYIAIFKDITDQKELQSKLILEAKTDFLTKLPNRSLFFDRLGQALKSAKRNRENGALIFIDLDHFKSINDTLGHLVGDLLLKEVAKRLQKNVRQADTVCRLSGDEFTIILPKISKPTDAGIVADGIIKSLIAPYHLDGHVLNMTCSAGIGVFFHDGDNAEALLTSADKAMYQAKQSGRNKFKFCSSKLDESSNEKRDIDVEVRKALSENGLFFKYRPILNNKGEIKEVDVELNLNERLFPKLKGIDFVSLSEESSLIVEVTDWMIENLAKRDIEILKFNNIKAGIKISSVHFKQSNSVEKLKNKFSKETAKFIKINIDETTISKNVLEASIKIKELSDYGFDISITNFGKGKLSFLDYKDLDFKYIQIDKISEDIDIHKDLLNIAEQTKNNIIISHELEKEMKKHSHYKSFERTISRADLFKRLKSI